MYRRALEGKEKAWGPEHTSTLDTVNNLGNLYANQGKMQEAEAMYRRALEGYEKAWGPEHTSTAYFDRRRWGEQAMPPEKRLGFWCYIHVESFVGLLKLLVMGLLKQVSTPSLGEAFISVFSRWKSLASSMILLARRCN